MKYNELDDGMTSDELRAREIAEMDPELKERWTTALRSGEYMQGEGYLRRRTETKDTFCCLGVLCDLTDPEHWELGDAFLGHYTDDIDNTVYHLGCSGLPTHSLLEEWGLFNVADKLAQMNDGGYSFEQIARYLEGNLPADESPEHVKEALDN